MRSNRYVRSLRRRGALRAGRLVGNPLGLHRGDEEGRVRGKDHQEDPRLDNSTQRETKRNDHQL